MTQPSTEPNAPESQPTGAGEPPCGLEDVPTALADAMRRRGYASLTAVQRAVLDAEADGRDLRISSQTGSGKTVAIGLALASCWEAGVPTGRCGPGVLVLVPTRELAMQVREELGWLLADVRGLGIEVVIGGTSLGVERQALSRGPQIVVGTPGRTLDHLKAGAIDPGAIEHVVLDESDRMLDMGFREELEAILERMPTERRTHLVSATFPGAVRKLADRFQSDPLHIEGTPLGDANQDIEHVAHLVERRQAYAAIVNLLLLNEGERCLVFVERRIDVGALAEKLSADGFAVQAFSGELAQAQRTRTLAAFRDGTIKTLISTDVAARGIDVPNIGLVIHADLPESADTYVHRSGRTGRAGCSGRSVLLVPQRSRRHIERTLGAARIDCAWRPTPGASQVRKHIRKRFRKQLHERLADEAGPGQTQIDYAKTLLDGREPAVVVAMLLELAEPAPARAPMEIREEPPSSGGNRSSGGSRVPGAPVRFTINWGERSGAVVKRVLAHVCRRGQIRSHLVGAIEVGPESSHFEVAASAAARFEKLVQRPDRRDPGLSIRRDTGSAESAPRHKRPAKRGSPPRRRASGGAPRPR